MEFLVVLLEFPFHFFFRLTLFYLCSSYNHTESMIDWSAGHRQ